MSVKSTRYITREVAIARIEEIARLVNDKNYRGIEEVTCEDYSVQDFVERAFTEYPDLTRLTDGMLEGIMDMPFFRFSMFDRYFCEG